MVKDPAFSFYPDKWFTPNTYNRNYKTPTDKSGVYLLVKVDFDLLRPNYEILYVGSSKSLSVRYSKHEVLRALKNTFQYVHFYFIEVANYLEVEKQLIKKIQPKYNKQWRE